MSWPTPLDPVMMQCRSCRTLLAWLGLPDVEVPSDDVFIL